MKKLALATVALLAAVSAIALGAPKGAHASGYCTYSVQNAEQYHAKNLPDGNYVNQKVTLWYIPWNAPCTEWAGHYWGDFQTETTLYLGTTADRFYHDTTSTFGWEQDIYGSSFPTSGDPFANGQVFNQWGPSSSLYFPPPPAEYFENQGTLGGTNGDTTIWETSTISDEECLSGANQILPRFEVSSGDGGALFTDANVSGNGYIMPYWVMDWYPNAAGYCSLT